MKDSIFDLEAEEINDKLDGKSPYQEKLDKADSLCIRELFDEALAIYQSIIDEDYKCVDAYVGVLRVHSVDFASYEGEQIEKDIRVIEKTMARFGVAPTSDEYDSYKRRKDAHAKEAEEMAEKRRVAEKEAAERKAKKEAAEKEAAERKAKEEAEEKRKRAEEMAKKRALEEEKRKKAEAERKKKAEAAISLYGLPFGKGVTVLTQKYVQNLFASAYGKVYGEVDVVIPPWVTTISTKAFYTNAKLRSVKIPSSVKSIGDEAFAYCEKLKEVVFSEGLESIGRQVFDKCVSLVKVRFPRSLRSVGSGAFRCCEGLRTIDFGQCSAPIPRGAFFDCTSLREVIIPNSVPSIGPVAFSGCYNLESLTLGSGIDYIDQLAFSRCKSLRSVTINCPRASLPRLPLENVFPDFNAVKQVKFNGTKWEFNRYWQSFYLAGDQIDITCNDGKLFRWTGEKWE